MNGKGRRRLKQLFVNSFGNKCCVCKKSHAIFVYDFHHINPKDKKFAISKGWTWNFRLLEEIQKCVMVCSNCHRLIEAGLATVPKDAIRFKEKNYRHCVKFVM